MSLGLYQSAISMASHEGRLNVLAANLANVDTPGFKRELASVEERAVQRELGQVRGVSNRMRTDFSQGNLVRTDRPYDLALQGRGFFAVDTPVGELYTRDGSFYLTGEGVLVTADGEPVAWEDKSGAIDGAGLPVLVDEEGNVRQGDVLVGRLRIVDFEDPDSLVRLPNGFWEAPEGANETTPTAVVHQGALEESNAKAMEELIEMIALQRSYESTSSAFSSLSEAYQRLTRPF